MPVDFDLERAVRYGFNDVDPDTVAVLLGGLAEHVPRAHYDLWGRHDLFPSAAALRDALVAALRGRQQLSVHETHRLSARACGSHLGFVVRYLRFNRDEGLGDAAKLSAYEEEFDAQQSPTVAPSVTTPLPAASPARLAHLLEFVQAALDEAPDSAFNDEAVLVAGQNLVDTLVGRVDPTNADYSEAGEGPWAACG